MKIVPILPQQQQQQQQQQKEKLECQYQTKFFKDSPLILRQQKLIFAT